MLGFAAGMEMADMAWEVKCRDEDMKQRALENERHAIDDARRAVDEKAAQLKVLAHQSALFAGFSMIVLVESQIPDDLNGWLLAVFGGTTASVIALMLISTLNSTYILVAILRYDCVTREVPFRDFWRKRCEPDWRLALRAFSYGVPLFMAVVALVAWCKFWKSEGRVWSAGVVTVIVLMATIFWYLHAERKWSGFLLTSQARVLTRGLSTHSKIPSDGDAESVKKGNKHGGKGEDVSASVAESLDSSSLAVGELTASEKRTFVAESLDSSSLAAEELIASQKKAPCLDIDRP